MSVKYRISLFTAILLISRSVFCQYNANSVYSRYGIGDIDLTGFTQNRALGGTAICLRQQDQINYLNPASYNSQDTMSFIWDIALFGNFSNTSTSSSSANRHSVNFDHLALAFPLSKKYFVSAGLVPFSKMGYRFLQPVDSTVYFANDGTGNINQFYFGNAFGLLKNHLNVGFNLSYIFGTLNTTDAIEYVDYGVYTSMEHVNSYRDRRLEASGFNLKLGLQADLNLSKDKRLIAGITIDPRTRLNMNYTDFRYRTPGTTDTLYNIDSTTNFYIPTFIGAGLSFILKDKLLIGADFSTQNWSKTSMIDSSSEATFKTSNKFNFGIQYTPNRESYRHYYEKINYRLGCYYNDSYLVVKGVPIKDYGITFGLGLPFRNLGTMFNVAVELGSRGETTNGLVRINYTRITLSLNLYDYWFIKRKYD